MDANVRLDHQLLAIEGEHRVHAMLELSSPEPPDGERDPLNLALIIDRSGSMNGPKLDAAKECARYLARRLRSTDRLALVTYDNEAELVAGLDSVDASRLDRVIDAIGPGGATNLSGGWLLGTEELRRCTHDGPRKALLLSDGLANQGIVEPGRLVGLAKQLADAGVGTTTIGFGEGFDEDLMTAMADHGSGSAYFAASPDDAPGIFAEEFDGLVALAAQNLSVELRPSPEVKLIGLLNEYPTLATADGITIQLGDVFGGERRRIVLELHVPEVASLGVQRIATIIVRYVGVGAAIEAHELTIPITVNLVSADEAAAADVDHEVIEEITVLGAARAQREARERADQGDYTGAADLLVEASEQLRSAAPGSARCDEFALDANAFEAQAATLRDGAYDAISRKEMTYQARDINRGRPGRQRKRPGDGNAPEGNEPG